MNGLTPKREAVFSNTLDIWPLGCIVHEILTTQIPFLESPDDGTSEIISGLSDASPERDVDIGALRDYCWGVKVFPVEIWRVVRQVKRRSIS